MNYLIRCHWQRGLFCNLSADHRRRRCPFNWKQEARLLSYLSYPYCAIAVKTCVSESPVCRDALILVNPVLIHVIGFRHVLARFLLLILVELSFLLNSGFGGSFWSWIGAELDWEVLVYWALVFRLVLVHSGQLHWDFLHRAVVLWRQIHLVLVLWLLQSAFRWDLPQETVLLCGAVMRYDWFYTAYDCEEQVYVRILMPSLLLKCSGAVYFFKV